MKINKIRPNFQFWTNIEIKMIYLVLPCEPGDRVMFWGASSNGNSLDFEFIRECMKINKMRLKFHFLTKQMT